MFRIPSVALLLSAILPSVLCHSETNAQVGRGALRGAGRVVVQVTVDEILPGSVRLIPGSSTSAVIQGGGLNRSGLTLEVKKKNGASAEGKVTAELGSATGGSSRGMTVKAKKSADPGKYTVLLKGANTDITLPFEVQVVPHTVAVLRAIGTPASSGEEGGASPVPRISPGDVRQAPATPVEDLKKRAAMRPGRGRLLRRPPAAAIPSGATAIYTDTAPAGFPPPSYRLGRLEAPPSHPPDPVEPPLSSGFGAKVKMAGAATGGKIGEKAGSSPLEVPKTSLEVRLLYKDLEKWGRHWLDTPARTLEFRWRTREEKIAGGRWEVSQGPGFGSVVLSGLTGGAPEGDGFGLFFIDFTKIAGLFSDFHVRVRPFRRGHLGTAGESLNPSPPVRVTVSDGAGAPTEFTDPAMGGPLILPLEVPEPEVLTLEVPETQVLPLEVPEPQVLPLEVPEPTTLETGEGGSARPPPRTIAVLPGPMEPRSGDLPPLDPSAIRSAGHVRLPDALLEVKYLSGDFAQWGQYSQESHAMVADFRVLAEVETETFGSVCQVAFTPEFQPNYWIGENICPKPKKGQYTYFSVDFRPYAEAISAWTQMVTQYSFFVRVIYGTYSDLKYSNTVEVAVTGESPPTEFE